MRTGILFGLLVGWALVASSAPDPHDFPRTTVLDDRPAVTLRHLARFYGFPRPRPDDRVVEMVNEQHHLMFERDSRRMQINGVNVWLHEPIIAHRRAWLVSAEDLRAAIDPVLRPSVHVEQAGYRVIVLDPGHGGRDEGGRGTMGTLEKDMVLTISRQVAALLQKAGHPVYMTREDDRYLSLEERVVFAREREADVFVSIHFNASANREARGTETFVLSAGDHPSTSSGGGETHPPPVPANAFDGANMLLGYSIQRNLLKTTENEDRGVRRARYFVLREAVSPAVLVECAFLTNPQEERELHRVEYQRRLAHGIAQGILEYLAATLRAQLQDVL